MTENIRYIDPEEALIIHSKTIDHSGGGTKDCLNYGQLECVLQLIQNDDYYPTFIDKLTHLFYAICKFHCFADGNKRLAITLTAEFLLKNGYMAIASSYFKETENISYHVAAGHISEELLKEVLNAILMGTLNDDESLKLKLTLAELVEDSFY